MNPAKRVLIGGAAAVVGVITLASASFACTTFRGKMTVTPQGAGSSGSVTVQANGGNMTSCTPAVGSATLNKPNKLQVVVSPSTSCTDQLPAATYTMSFVNGGPAKDCMYGASIGSVSVDANGNAPATLSSAISPNGTPTTPGKFQFCISNANNFTGLQAQLSAI